MLLTEFFSQPDLSEHIVKVKGGYELKSKKTGKNLGKYPTRAGAEKRERQVQYFKHANEDMAVSNLIATEDSHMPDVITARQLIGAAKTNPNKAHEYHRFINQLRNKHGKEYSTQVHQQASKLSEDQWSGPNSAWGSSDHDEWHSGSGQWSESAEDSPVDTITVDVPLFIRLLEYAREDAESDLDLHHVTERITALSADGHTLNMADYNAICGSKE